jgi:hypothetical protein
MAGYSGTPLPKKLGIKDEHRVALLHAPDGFDKTLGELPSGVTFGASLAGKQPLDVIVLFVKSRVVFEKELPKAAARLADTGGLWIAWPKKASKVPTDMTEDVIREVALPGGLVDNKVCAIDEVWSGLRLVVRVENRGKKR